MKNDSGLANGNADLRRRAELRLGRRRPAGAVRGPDADARKLLHELQVHQVELEMQNEELRQARVETDAALQQYTDLYDFAPIGCFTLGRDGGILQANLAGAGLLGVERDRLIGRHFELFFDARERSVFAGFLGRVFANRDRQTTELAMPGRECAPRFLHIEADAGVSGHDCRLAVTDITGRKQAEEALEIAASVHQAIGEAVLIADADNRILAVNPAFTRVTGYAAHEAIGQSPGLLKSGRQDKLFYQQMWQALESTGQWQGEIWNRRKNGEVYPEWLAIYTIYDGHGGVLRRIALFSDITEQKRSQEIIRRQANFDPLTHLPNRRLFHDRLEHEVRKAHREGQTLALLFIDLDHFKEVNDTLGHGVGDVLLVEASRRIVGCVRESDTVARLGGDEFTVILPGQSEPGIIERIARSIIGRLAEPYVLADEQAYASASIGITLYPSDATKAGDLLKNADQAMYAAKRTGRNRYSYFTPDMQRAAQTRMRLTGDLHAALDRNQLRVVYQPIVELATNSIHKAEALVRWQHPERGLINPAEFIPLAEETGMIIEIGDHVFKDAARQVQRWRALHHPGFQISVNKSPVQFRSQHASHLLWPDHLQGQGLPCDGIAIEITEGLLMDDNAHVVEKLETYRAAGMQISLDDFGTGYSSLSYMKKFDLDYLKIDKSFVRGLENGANDMALCEAIIVMAHKLGMKVIAEGIETKAQCGLLAAAGCDYGQGYLFSRPLPAEEFEAMLKGRR